uniref:Ig-like domain-containing protein n=1 Tax=Takifugu rubripes TaxID=31033 RepID=A0A674NGH1_TAKRU
SCWYQNLLHLCFHLNFTLNSSNVTLESFLDAEPPYFVETLEPMEVTAGDAVCLKCKVAGTPEIKVSWFKADGKLSKATKTDIGEYTCKAENSIGSASSSCRLSVQGKYFCSAMNDVGKVSCSSDITVKGI